MKHDPCGPSQLYRRKECPPSMLAERGLPEENNDDSIEGTMLHAIMATPVEERDVSNLDDEQLECIEVCDDLVDSYSGEGEPWQHEVFMELKDDDGNIITFGTCDLLKLIPEKGLAIIADYKFGRNEVDDPGDNIQMGAYSGMVLQKYPKINRVLAIVVQPRIRTSDHPSYLFTDLDMIRKTVETIISNCHDMSAKRHAGVHCRYCKARHECAERLRFIRAITTFDMNTLENMPPIADILSACTQMEKDASRVRNALKDMARTNGGVIGDHELHERGRGFSVRCEYECANCGNKWEGEFTMSCPECGKNKILLISGGNVDFYNEISSYLSTGEFMQLCEPKMGVIEDWVTRRMKDMGHAPTLKAAKMEFEQGTTTIIKKKPVEVLRKRKGEIE